MCDDKTLQLKKKLAWRWCSYLLVPPITPANVVRLSDSDTEEVKAAKRRENAEQQALKEEERRRREPELLKKFNEIIERVRASRSEGIADNEEVWSALAVDNHSRLKLVCGICKNEDQNCFKVDPCTGDTICLGVDRSGCGNVIQDHVVDEGQEFRIFAEDSEDRNHYGPNFDPLMPDSENLKTVIVGSDATFKKLRRTNQDVEMNLSNIGNDDRRTRRGYRSEQKRMAFELMGDICANLQIHDSVFARAREEFARYRDVRQHLHGFYSVVAACLVLAFEDVGQISETKEPIQETTSVMKLKAYHVLDGLNHILESNDVAIVTLQNTPIGKWDKYQVKAWLQAIFGKGHDAAINRVVQEVSSEECSGGTPGQNPRSTAGISIQKKRKYPTNDAISSCFGSTTMNKRRKRIEQNMTQTRSGDNADAPNSNRNTTERNITSMSTLTCGQKLIRLNIDSLSSIEGQSGLGLTENEVKVIKTALKVRATYEGALIEKERLEELESFRLRAESRHNQVDDILSKSRTGFNSESSRGGSLSRDLEDTSGSHVLKAEDDDLLTHMLEVSQRNAHLADAVGENNTKIDSYSAEEEPSNGNKGRLHTASSAGARSMTRNILFSIVE